MKESETDRDGSFAAVTYEQWREVVVRGLQGAPFDRRLVSRTDDDIPIEPLYSEAHDPGPDAAGFPGLPPYTRGGAPLGIRQGWQVAQRIGHPDPERAAREAREEVEQGATALWLVAAAPARAGRDADDEAMAATRGADDGILLSRLADLDRLLGAIDLMRTPVYLDAGGSALPAAALLLAHARERGIGPEALRGSLDADPLGALAADGRLPVSLDRSLIQLADLASWCQVNAPGLRAATISTLPYHDAGAAPAQEIAFALASGIAYLRPLLDAGLSLQQASEQLTFRFAVGRDVFVELAKLRAARLAWSRVVEACGASGAGMRIHACTAWRTQSERDPWVNMLRGTAETFAAAAGGAEAITSLPFDTLLGEPDALGRRTARNTQIVLREEAYLDRVADPAGGSWYVETMTRQLADAAWSLMQQLEAVGGMGRALVGGRIHQLVHEARSRRYRAIAKRRQPITGVSAFPDVHEEKVTRAARDGTALRQAAAEALNQHRGAVDQTAVTAPLATIAADSAADAGALTEAAIEAARRGATLGSIAETIRGDTSGPVIEPLRRRRDAESFERLRAASDAYLSIHGRRPRVFLANMGPIPQHGARAEFCSSLLQAGGLEPLGNDGHATVEQAAEAFAASAADGAVICSTDDDYPETAPALGAALKARGARFVALAGRPRDHEERYRASGVDDFLYLGGDAERGLSTLLQRLGVPL